MRTAGVLASIVLLSVALPSAARAEPDESKALAERLDAYLRNCAAFGWSGSVLIARDGEVLLRRGYGLAEREGARANDAETLFEIASITKVFTAYAVMTLVEAGTLELDDPVSKHLPGVPEDKRDITVRHLLSHTSGMGRMSGGGGSDAASAVTSYLGHRRARAAGAAVEYWNGGYALLAALIERVSKMSFQAYVRKSVLEPAGMKHSGFTGEALPRARQAVGYDGEQAVRFAAEHPYGAYDFRYKGMGGLVTSADDLWCFAQALRANRVVSAETNALMTAAVSAHQGLGWGVLESERGTVRLVHGGDVKGFHCALELLPDERGAVIVLSNVEGVPAWKLQWNLGALLFGETPRYAVPPTVASVEPDLLDAYAGVYRRRGGSASLTLERAGAGFQVGAEGTAAAAALSSPGGKKTLDDAVTRARAVLDAVIAKDADAVRAMLPDGVFWAESWPPILVDKIWPEKVAERGALIDVRAIGAEVLGRGAIRAVLGLRHEGGDFRMAATFQRDGRLTRLVFEGPRFAVRRAYMPVSDSTIASFDWNSDQPLPTIEFSRGSDERRVLRVKDASGSVEYVRE